MRITCPFCGERELGEFTYLGDAVPRRPSSDAAGAPATGDAFFDYVYLRENPFGEMREHWYHGGGCRSWLVVTRNTATHEIKAVEASSGAGAARAG